MNFPNRLQGLQNFLQDTKKNSQIHTFSTKAKSNLIQACPGRWTSTCYYLQLHQIFKAYYIFLPRNAEPVIHIGTCVYVSLKQHFNGVQPTFWSEMNNFGILCKSFYLNIKLLNRKTVQNFQPNFKNSCSTDLCYRFMPFSPPHNFLLFRYSFPLDFPKKVSNYPLQKNLLLKLLVVAW